MKIKPTCIALALLMAASAADAQAETRKLYRWVDKDGKVQFSDTLPQEALDQARTEMTADSGRTTGAVERALTAEEQAEIDRLAAEQEIRQRAEEKERQSEEAMLASFQTEEDLRRSFGVRVTLMQENLNAIEAGIGSQRNSLTNLLAQASESELNDKPVNVKQAATIRELRQEMAKQQNMLIVKQAELMALDETLEYMVERFHALKSGDQGRTSPTANDPAG